MPLCGTHNDLCFGREDGALGAMGAMGAMVGTCRHTSLHAYSVCRTCVYGLNIIASSVFGCLLVAHILICALGVRMGPWVPWVPWVPC